MIVNHRHQTQSRISLSQIKKSIVVPGHTVTEELARLQKLPDKPASARVRKYPSEILDVLTFLQMRKNFFALDLLGVIEISTLLGFRQRRTEFVFIHV